jgi:hypothetical protein
LRGWHHVRVSLPDLLAALDALAALYLLSSLRRSRRNRQAVAAVALTLLLAAGGLLWIGRPHHAPPDAPGPAPVAPGANV